MATNSGNQAQVSWWAENSRLVAAFVVGALVGGLAVAEFAPGDAREVAIESGAESGQGGQSGGVNDPSGTTGGADTTSTTGTSQSDVQPGESTTTGTATTDGGTTTEGSVASDGSGTTTGGSGTTTTDGNGTTTDGSGASTDGSGASTDGSGTSTDGSGTTTDGSGASTDGSGTSTDGSGTGTDGSGTNTDGGSTDGGGSDGGSTTTDGSGSGGGSSCSRDANGGETDRGVTRDEVFMATTEVQSGIGKAFLGDVKFAMEALRNKVNRQGGICGRQLKIKYRDDGWDAQRGRQFLNNFIQEGAFAIPVGPSSEGLNAAIEQDDFTSTNTPVVGTDGMIIRQYQESEGDSTAQPWVWPVAVATVSSARILAFDAYNRMEEAGTSPKPEDFGIVFDRNFRFGREAALAYNNEVKRLTGGNVPGFNDSFNCQENFCGIEAGQSSYSSQVSTMSSNFDQIDYVALFMEPQTALTWMNDRNMEPASDQSTFPQGIGASQTLFTRNFAENCKDRCDQMQIWTGFKPNEEEYRNDPAVQTYVDDLKQTNPNADEFNQFAEGGYIGMQLLVEAMKQVGPNLTRERLKAVLDEMSFQSGLTLDQTLEYSPDNRYAASTMQAWIVQYKGSFGGWRSGQVVGDPQPRAGIG